MLWVEDISRDERYRVRRRRRSKELMPEIREFCTEVHVSVSMTLAEDTPGCKSDVTTYSKGYPSAITFRASFPTVTRNITPSAFCRNFWDGRVLLTAATDIQEYGFLALLAYLKQILVWEQTRYPEPKGMPSQDARVMDS